jgi:hypothetical protein
VFRNRGSKTKRPPAGGFFSAGAVNVVSLFLGLALLAGIYLSWKYIPIVSTKSDLSNLVREATFTAARVTDEQIRRNLIEGAKLDLNVDLQSEDVEITRYSDRVRIRVTWRPVVRFPLGKSVQHAFEISEGATTY